MQRRDRGSGPAAIAGQADQANHSLQCCAADEMRAGQVSGTSIVADVRADSADAPDRLDAAAIIT
jgi:hypothetical protein